MTGVEGRYFFPHAARFVEARASAVGRNLHIEDLTGNVLADISARQVRISPRLGRLVRRFEISDGSRFETSDQDGAEQLRRALALRRRGSVLHALERSWQWAMTAVAIAAILSFLFVEFGIPALARSLADETPQSVAAIISRQTLQALDQTTVDQTLLSTADQKRAQALFRRVSRHAPRGTDGYRLEIRHGGAIGANAFALPDGTIVMTDELWRLVRNDEEIEGVFGHEMAHVDRRHGLQSLYQAALIPAALALITGDVSQVTQLAAILPGIVVQSRYSQSFEQEADDDSARLMNGMGARPSRLADLLERLEAKQCGAPGCPTNWLGSHPDTKVRAARLRAETAKK